MPLTYDRALVDPGGASRLLVSFTCGTDPIDHEWQTPACIERCMKALYAAHPEVAAALIKLMLGRF